MSVFETFATDAVDPARRLEFWNEVACNTFTPVVADPMDLSTFCRLPDPHPDRRVEDFRGSLGARYDPPHPVPGCEVAGVVFLPGAPARRQQLQPAERARRQLLPGDFTLCASMLPYEMHLPATARRLVLGISESMLRRHLACPESVLGIRMSGNRGMSGLLADFVRSLWLSRLEPWDPSVTSRLSYTVLDLIAAAYSVTPHSKYEPASLATAHRTRILGYIENHLRDPEPRSNAYRASVSHHPAVSSPPVRAGVGDRHAIHSAATSGGVRPARSSRRPVRGRGW